ncbi:MAG: site-specific integrase [Bacteroidetes bacterium]|nr:site-specific integrase [Bacteroidota bacterium]
MATIHFYPRFDRPIKDGSVTVCLMFSLNRTQRLKISTGKLIPLRKEYSKLTIQEIEKIPIEKREEMYYWDFQKERATKGFSSWENLNNHLDKEKVRANDIVSKFEDRGRHLTLELFKNAFSKISATDNFKEYFTVQLEQRKHLISKETYKGYKSVITKVDNFKPNVTIGNIDYRFLTLFENHMLKPIIEKGLGNIPSTVSKTMKSVRALIQIAIKNNDFPKEAYPFIDYRIKHVDPLLTSRDYLEPEDLTKIEDLLSPERISELTIGEIKAVKRFLFGCYTGLRFSDVNNLFRSKHIFAKWVHNPQTKESLYKHYIELRMGKTDQPVFIPLIDKALDLINEAKDDKIFDTISNQKINKHLKNINTKAKLNKKLSFHVSRHSFATICFLYGIPEKVGQKLLGHKNRKFTEIYTHLSQNKLFYEMDKLNRGLSNYELLVDETDDKKTDMKEIMPMLQNLSPEKLEQIKGLIKLIDGKAA